MNDIAQAESSDPQNPKDEQITNQDTSVTNADPETDTGESTQENKEKEPEEVTVPTVTPDNSGDPGPPEEQSPVDKGDNNATPTE